MEPHSLTIWWYFFLLVFFSLKFYISGAVREVVEDMEGQEFDWHSDAWWEKHKKMNKNKINKVFSSYNSCNIAFSHSKEQGK